ncbi:hypothetical protein ACFSQ7_19685 [Paenibacillus rhizoplanae]
MDKGQVNEIAVAAEAGTSVKARVEPPVQRILQGSLLLRMNMNLLQ